MPRHVNPYSARPSCSFARPTNNNTRQQTANSKQQQTKKPKNARFGIGELQAFLFWKVVFRPIRLFSRKFNSACHRLMRYTSMCRVLTTFNKKSKAKQSKAKGEQQGLPALKACSHAIRPSNQPTVISIPSCLLCLLPFGFLI